MRHCVEKYGRAEVEQWYWEVWNEANISGYWHGTPEEFYKLHDYAIAAVRRALPTARVGGPDCAGDGGPLMKNFLEHCLRGTNYATGQTRHAARLRVVSRQGRAGVSWTATCAWASPTSCGPSTRLRDRSPSYPELNHKPIVIGESDPEGCAACQGPQLGYRNGTMYSSYTAASFARMHDLADRRGVNLEGALDLGVRVRGPAVLRRLPLAGQQRHRHARAERLPHVRQDGRRSASRRHSSGEVPLDAIMRDGVRGAPDVAALASLDGKKLCVLVWHYHDDDVAGPDAAVEVQLSRLPLADGAGAADALPHRSTHSNAFAAWQRMGSPTAPTPRSTRNSSTPASSRPKRCGSCFHQERRGDCQVHTAPAGGSPVCLEIRAHAGQRVPASGCSYHSATEPSG